MYKQTHIHRNIEIYKVHSCMGEHIHGVGQCETEKRERADWCRMTFPVLPLPANTMESRTTGQRSSQTQEGWRE